MKGRYSCSPPSAWGRKKRRRHLYFFRPELQEKGKEKGGGGGVRRFLSPPEIEGKEVFCSCWGEMGGKKGGGEKEPGRCS